MTKTDFYRAAGQLACAVLLAASSGIAVAQTGSDDDVVSANSSNSGDWEFTLSPLFLWGMGISGDATIGDKTLPLEVEFGDIWSNLDTVFTVHFEARKDKWNNIQ